MGSLGKCWKPGQPIKRQLQWGLFPPPWTGSEAEVLPDFSRPEHPICEQGDAGAAIPGEIWWGRRRSMAAVLFGGRR